MSVAEGFAIIPNWMARDPQVSPHAKAVYVNLSSRTNREGRCWPGQALIASETGYSTRQVKRAVVELVALGVVSVDVIKTKHGRRNAYTLSMGVVTDQSPRVVTPTAQEEEPVEQEPLL